MESIREALTRAIERSGVSLREIARQTGVNVTTISRFMEGKGISIDNAGELAKYLDLELVPRKGRRRSKGR